MCWMVLTERIPFFETDSLLFVDSTRVGCGEDLNFPLKLIEQC